MVTGNSWLKWGQLERLSMKTWLHSLVAASLRMRGSYECMESGSLDVWLRNRAVAVEALDRPTRFKSVWDLPEGSPFCIMSFFFTLFTETSTLEISFWTVNLSHGWQSGSLGGVDGCKWEGR